MYGLERAKGRRGKLVRREMMVIRIRVQAVEMDGTGEFQMHILNSNDRTW